jgi:hypothetical protein|nr:MAG TPA: hypothetical protein [Caudoviricetes sp.]
MAKLDPKTLDLIAELEVDALLEGLHDEDLRKSPAFLEKVRKFLKENRLITQPQTQGVQELEKEVHHIPDFDPFDLMDGNGGQ